MGLNSNIEWTDHTINLWWGCSKVHTGCKNCYAEHLSDVRYKNDLWGENKPRRIVKGAFDKLRQIQNIGQETGIRQRVFIGSMMDIFEESKSVVDAKGNQVFHHVDGEPSGTTTQHLREKLFYEIHSNMYDMIDFQLLTKRPENAFKSVPYSIWENPPSNVMIGASVSNQETYHQMMASLVLIPFKKFLSVEPMIGPIDIDDEKNVDWIIVGGESGPKKRPFDTIWASNLQYKAGILRIPYFFKQIDKVQDIPEAMLVREFPR